MSIPQENTRSPGALPAILTALFCLGLGLNFMNAELLPLFNSAEIIIEEEVEIPYETERILDPSLSKGQIVLIQKGERGLVRQKYAVLLRRGAEFKRRLLEHQIIREAKKEVTALGTKNTIIQSSRSFSAPRKVYRLYTTAYTHTGNPTFTGVYPHIGTIAVDPAVIPLGSRLWVEGYGYGVAEDTGGLIHGNIIDLFMDSREECLAWGRKKVNVYLLQ